MGEEKPEDHTKGSLIMHLRDTPDELSFCDDDIRATFENTAYFLGIPTLVQLCREVRKLRSALIAKEVSIERDKISHE